MGCLLPVPSYRLCESIYPVLASIIDEYPSHQNNTRIPRSCTFFLFLLHFYARCKCTFDRMSITNAHFRHSHTRNNLAITRIASYRSRYTCGIKSLTLPLEYSVAIAVRLRRRVSNRIFVGIRAICTRRLALDDERNV